jgi:hypothetical protein
MEQPVMRVRRRERKASNGFDREGVSASGGAHASLGFSFHWAGRMLRGRTTTERREGASK